MQKKTVSILAASAAIVGAAALLHARGREPEKVTVASCGEGAIETVRGMTIAVRPRSCEIVRGAETHVAVEISAPETKLARREPIAMSLVVDRSGSMIGEPLEDAKLAALRAIDALEERDTFSLVAYSTRAELLLPLAPATESHKAQARAVIERMRADGGTNISDGLTVGSASLDNAVAFAREHIERIVLISDGDPNEGIYDRDGLARLAARTAEEGTSITTIGVGLDFNERIMTDMAVAGRGNYYFVEQPSDLGNIVAQELGSLGETVAVDTRLELTAAPGFEIAEAYGYRTDRKGDATVVPIADLRAGETRKVVLRMRVTATALGTHEMVAARLTWREIGQHQGLQMNARVAVAISDDPEAAARTTIAAAEKQVQEAAMAKALDEANDAYARGDAKAAEQIVETQYQRAAAAAPTIGDAEFEGRMDTVRKKAKGAYAKPGGGKKALKDNANMSYGLSR